MAVERIYEQQTSPRAAAAMPLASPDSFGAGVGEAASQLGATLHGAQVQAYSRERQQTQASEAADWSHRFSVYRETADARIREARANAGPGAAGHAAGVKAAVEAEREALLGGITEDNVRRYAQGQWDEFNTRLIGQEGDFEEGRRVAKIGTDVEASTDAAGNRIRNSADPKVYADEVKLGQAQIDALPGVPADVRAKLKHEQVDQKFGVAFLNQLIDSNPAAALALVNSNEFNFLQPDQLEAVRNGAQVEIRRSVAALEHSAALAASGLREQIATLREADEQGLEVDDSQFAAAIGAAQQLKDTSTVLDLQGRQANNQFAKIYSGQSPLQREQRLAVLKGDKRPSVTEQREMKWLEDKRSALDARFEADPVAFAIENAPAGFKPPAGDIADPAVLEGRIAWRRRTGNAYGRELPLFSGAEQRQLAARQVSGAAGEAEVMELIDQVPEGGERAGAAKQIAPADKLFQHMAQLEPQHRAMTRAGSQALKANPKLVSPSEEEEPEARAVMDELERRLNGALKEFEPADREAVRTVAQQWMAGVLDKGQHGTDQITQGMYDTAIRVALGGSIIPGKGTVGGLGNWNGSAFVLPDRVNNGQFGLRVAEFLIKNPNDAPVNPDGSRIPIELLRPVLIGPNLYRWESANGRVAHDRQGKPFIASMEPRR